MKRFTITRIVDEPNSLGNELRRRREALGWTIKKACRETRLLPSYLEAIETDQLEALPEEPVRSNFVRSYIRALGNDPELVLLASVRLANSETRTTTHHKLPPRQVWFAPTHRHLKLAGLGLVLAVLVTYLGIQIQALREPPLLLVTTPTDRFVTDVPTIEVLGLTEPEARLLVNEEVIPKQTNGAFAAVIDLHRGTNIISIEAQRKHSKPRRIYRTVIFENAAQISRK